jgi:DNA-binding response OmpR family regulator
MAYSYYPASIDQQPGQGPNIGLWPFGGQAHSRPPAAVARVLVSEDDASIQRIYASLLPGHGFELLTVPGGDGPLTVALAHRFQPDLLITDVNKPGLDGAAVCRALRNDERTARLPLLMVTAMDELLERQRGSSADDYMVKPFGFEGLIYRITTLLNLRRPARVRVARHSLALADETATHPVTGLPGPHMLHRLLPTLTATANWAIAALRIEQFASLVRSYGRAIADSLLLRLASIVRSEAEQTELFVAHSSLDASLVLAGPTLLLDALPERIAERFANEAARRLRLQDRPPPALRLNRIDASSGTIAGLPELVGIVG